MDANAVSREVACACARFQRIHSCMSNVALIVGSSGVVGQNLASLLVGEEWDVFGLARRPLQQDGVTAVAADLQDAASLQRALADVKPTHVFLTTWLRQPPRRITFA